MLNKISARILIALVILVLFIFAATREEPIQEIVPVTIYTNQSVPKVVLSDAQIIKRAGEYIFTGSLTNSSVIPITLVITKISCDDGIKSNKYRVTSAVQTKELQVEDPITREKKKTTQIVPAEIKIGETYLFETAINNFEAGSGSCVAEVESWSKYEEQ